MISQLTIQNFGLIDRLQLEFGKRLNVLSGETGAGKSILIDALRYALGERLDINQVRNQESACIVEAVFDLDKDRLKNSEAFRDFIADGSSELIISRVFQADGRNKIKINGFSATVAQLKEVGDQLVDFHGAHDHQMLFSSGTHIMILDRLCDFKDLKKEYLSGYRDYLDLLKKLQEIKDGAESRERDLDLLRRSRSG